MTHAALLPTRGDPFSIMLNLHFFETVWQGEVDRYHILLNSSLEREVVDFLAERAMRNPKVTFTYVDHPLDHGPSLTALVTGKATEDVLVLMEDDFLVYKKGCVDAFFKVIEGGEYDIVGDPSHQQCDGELAQAIAQRFPGPTESWWPCFFFARRADLLKTDLHFSSKRFEAGVPISLLNYTPTVLQCADTFVWMSLELKALGLKALNIDHHRDSSMQGNYSDYSHNGTISSAVDAIFTDDEDRPLSIRKLHNAFKYETTLEGGGYEMERRLVWHLLMVEQFWKESEPIAEFRDLYKKAIRKYSEKFHLFGGDWEAAERMARDLRQKVGLPEPKGGTLP
jgi:hypothetical protein